jgi:hypothetical protein
MTVRPCRASLTFACALWALGTGVASAQWITFNDETSIRLPSDAAFVADPDEKNFAVVDIDHDGDMDIVDVHAGLAFSPPLPRPHRLLLNDGAGGVRRRRARPRAGLPDASEHRARARRQGLRRGRMGGSRRRQLQRRGLYDRQPAPVLPEPRLERRGRVARTRLRHRGPLPAVRRALRAVQMRRRRGHRQRRGRRPLSRRLRQRLGGRAARQRRYGAFRRRESPARSRRNGEPLHRRRLHPGLQQRRLERRRTVRRYVRRREGPG